MTKIVIDAGHGKDTAGKRCLKSTGHQILRVDNMDGSTDVPLTTRVQKTNAWKSDYYVLRKTSMPASLTE